ncbi:hypothetical protein CLAFUW4_00424 [Fulvia fulva]|uniref:Uncharacterized protein n=1 Tax=Passalora fulva TaxID=5499 RepID=A0A9Q8P3G2_PASFU|nr:uncharacterized protein CLAFUR5_00426 [Fulvia fulva]KAK4636218.1 hypothetical protein CLAFUR4_00424 [Fulvia fulva]KAK4637084.1 hypothetical protein CLAFUR0_00425 [Fulvia fulva]UJO11908.1 hypothetical protein CLAFUR5_00426 [Fulvia fulva]WPV09239.1 hypothetical protein CLAFUW4_00424 [Fulvia fulva]WPV24335.1 hypothetical protein CLAFUW7_00428 [Fulvia fulva]
MSAAATKTETAFTARDFQLLAKAMNCMKTELAVDYAKFAELSGLKNANSAKASWHALKKKIDKAGEGSVSYSGEPDTAGAPPKSKKRKSTANDEGGDDGEGEEIAAPAKAVKKGRKPKAPSAAAKAKAEAEAVDSIEKADEENGEDVADVKEEVGGEDEGGEEAKVKDEAANED